MEFVILLAVAFIVLMVFLFNTVRFDSSAKAECDCGKPNDKNLCHDKFLCQPWYERL